MSSEIQTKIGESTGKTLYSWDGKVWFSTIMAAGWGQMTENERLKNLVEVRDIQIRCLGEEMEGFLDDIEEVLDGCRKFTREQI